MKLVHLSAVSIITCLLGLLLLVLVTINSIGEVREKQAQVAELLAVQARINDFSVASNSLLLFGDDGGLLAAYQQEGQALQQRVLELGTNSAGARKTAHRVEQLINAVSAEVERDRDPDATTPGMSEGALEMPARSRIVMNQVAGLGAALDSALDTLLSERQRAIAREAWWIGATLAGVALLFGMLAMIAFFLIHRRVALPARTITHTIKAIRAGDTDARAILHRDDELADLSRTLNGMLDEREALDARLREQNRGLRQFQQLIEGSDDLCVIIDGEYRYRWANRAYLSAYRIKREALEGRTLPEIAGERLFKEKIQPRLDRCLAGEPQRFEIERAFEGVGTRRFLVRQYPIDLPETPSERRVGLILTDITEIRAAETQLTRQRQLLDMAGRAARFGGWFADLENNRIEWSDAVAEIHGMPHGYSPAIDEGIAFYAPEYRERIRELFTACIEQGVPYDEELQILDANGQRVWVRTLGEPVRDEHGRIVHARGAFQDVTARHEHEAELRASRDELAALLVSRKTLINSLPAHIAVLDAAGTIVEVNDQWRHFGENNAYSGDDFGLGVNYIRLCETASGDCADEAADVAAGLRAVLDGEQDSFALEYPCHSPQEHRWFRVTANRLVPDDSDGAQHGAVVMHVDITERKRAEQQLERSAFEDPLTGLYTRNGFARQLQQWIEKDGWPASGAVVMVDIVSLRDVNDTFGFEGGDHVLVEFSRRLAAQAGERALAGRIAGDEFSLFLRPDASKPLETRMDRLIESLSAPIELDGLEIQIAIRLGYARMGEHPRPPADLLREAEAALFHHRTEPSLPWVAYSSRLEDETRQRIALTREMREALKEGQFELHFQPQVELATGRLASCEALLRWNHPERGLIPPGLFIPIAEQNQLIGPIGDWVLRRACQHLREWRDAGLEPVRVSVNVSLIQFQIPDFTDRVRAIIEEFGVQPEELALEITESVFEHESGHLLNQMLALHDMGVWLSLDDFGTGYSSLTYLQRYPFDEIKIDQTFVFRLPDDSFSNNVIATVIFLARALKAQPVAEGIESAAVSDKLQAMGCRFGQGYYYSIPLEAEDFRWLLEQRSRLPLTDQSSQ